MIQIDLKDIRSVTDFQKNIKAHVQRLKKTNAPMILTVNGSAELVVQSSEAYQALIDEVERARFITAVSEGIRQMDAGQSVPAEAALKEMREKLGL